MKFTVDFTKSPTTPSLLLVIGFVQSALLFIGLIMYFIIWNIPDNIYFRAVLVDIIIILVGAYFNDKYPQKG